MLMQNISKETIQPFSIGNEERVTGSYMAVDAGVPVRKEKRAMVEKFVGPIKPGAVVDIPEGLTACMGGIKPRGSYLAQIGVADKLAPVTADKLAPVK